MERVNPMNKRILYIILGLVLIAGCSNKPSEPANLQVLSMIPGVNDASVEITPINTSSDKKTITLPYAEPSGYYSFEPGKYDITYKKGAEPLLKHSIVLGKESYQTLMAAGMLPDSFRVNPHTTMFTVKKALAGSESLDPNGYMPQFIMLRDLYRGKKNQGMIRLVNASPFAKNVTLKKGKKKLQTLTYPKYGEPTPVKTGLEPFNFFMGSVRLNQKNMELQDGYIHTIITGNSTSSDTSLTVATYKTASESIRSK